MLKNLLERRRNRKKKGKEKETSLKVLGPPGTTTSSLPLVVLIRVRQVLILPIPTTAPNPPPPNLFPSHLYVIQGTFEDIRRYAGETVDWLIKVAHLIFDPAGRGQLFTHTSGTVDDWYEVGRTHEWRQVTWGEELQPGIYEYDTDYPIILSKISECHVHSRTSLASVNDANHFSALIRKRDGDRCVVTGAPRSLIASHLIPKRIGSDGAIDVVTRFSGAAAAPGIDRFNPRIGILLVSTLDKLVDLYEVGFYHETDNTYLLHNFVSDEPDLPVVGTTYENLPASSQPPLHLFRVTLSVHDGTESLPEKGTFDWHYLQCVLKVFGTQAYRNLPGITYFVYPFKTESDDSIDEYPDNDDIESPWPTYHWDRFLREQGKRQMERERHKAVEKWTSEVSTGDETQAAYVT